MPEKYARIWALVMDSTRARLLRGLHSPDEPGQSELVMRSDAPKLRQIMSDRPGPAVALRVDRGRAAMECSRDYLAEDEREFLRQVLSLLDSHRRAGDFTSLVVFADPHVLRHLRREMGYPLKDRVAKEVPRNLLHLSALDLPRTILHDIGSDHPFA